MRLLQICFVLLAVRGVPAQQVKAGAELTRASFSTSGLSNAKVLTNLYLGDFLHVDLERNAIMFKVLYNNYLEAFARRCDAYLPANKVEMTRSVCAREQYPVNRYGAQVGASTCVEYRTEGTGLYADPALYAAEQQLDRETALDAVGQVMRTMTQSNPLGSAMNTLNSAQVMTNDMNALVRLNACTSPGLKRFQGNLMLFALGKSPIRLAGDATPSSPGKAGPGAPFKDSNYTKLLEDLVSEQSKTWMMNRFVAGSVSSVAVSSRDAAGRPSKLVGRYLFNGRSQGSVTVIFTEGLPACLYFFDLPSVCRAASSRVIAAYENGNYQQ
jgi:hypothetical protein